MVFYVSIGVKREKSLLKIMILPHVHIRLVMSSLMKIVIENQMCRCCCTQTKGDAVVAPLVN